MRIKRPIKVSFRKLSSVFFALILLGMFGVILKHNLQKIAHQQFVYLADSFSNGVLYFQNQFQPLLTRPLKDGSLFWIDTSEHQGKHYWPLGVFPAILLWPFVILFGTGFLQGYLSFPLTVLNFFLLIKIAQRFSFTVKDSTWFAASFIFGSAYLGVAAIPVSWYFAHVVAVSLLLLAIYEYFHKVRLLRVGVWLALAIATRASLVFASLFFILMILYNGRKKTYNLLCLCIPILCSLLFIFTYNKLRFDNYFEFGYSIQNLPQSHLIARSFGLLNWQHIPGNLFFLLFRGPNPVVAIPNTYVLQFPYIVPDIWGMSIFITSPIFVYLFIAPWEDKMVKASAAAILFILILHLLYYGIGPVQFGYRYALDFYPFVYLILLKAFSSKITIKGKYLIVLSFILDWHFVSHLKI